MSEYAIFNPFPIPVIYWKFEHHHKYSVSKIPYCTKKPKDWDADVYTSFPNISDDDKFISKKFINELKTDLKVSIDKCFENLSIENEWYYKHFWYNVYNDKQFQESHNHLGTCESKNPFWCGIYYNKNASPTFFQRTDFSRNTHMFSGCFESLLKESFYDKWYLHVEDGDIILFPPYLQHFVPMSQKNEMRLTFSFNLYLKETLDEKVTNLVL